MLLFATALSFMDRQILSISIIRIKDDLQISDADYGLINTCFLISYSVMFTLGGFLIDKYGSRLGLLVSVGFWSLATLLHGICMNAYQFGFFRFLLGIGEGGCFPGAVKAVMEWIPKSKSAIANGIAIGGSAVGALIAPPLCAVALTYINWRFLFFIIGISGLIWVYVWWSSTKSIPIVSEKQENTKSTIRMKDLLELVKNRDAIVFMLIRFLLDPIFYFYMFWIPKYLNEIKGLSLNMIGNILWIPFLSLGIANVIGGGISDWIYRRTSNINLAREISMCIAALLTLPIMFVNSVNSITIIIAVMSLAFFAHGIWITNYITATGDVFGKAKSSSVVGLSGSVGAISSIIVNSIMGFIIATYSYSPLWIYCGIMYPISFIIFYFYYKNKKLIYD
jgi:ACS family hexuronate transporter-like MFS transporter